MKSHQPKIDWGQSSDLNNIKNEKENDAINNDEVIEEQINSNIENSRSKIENKSKLGNSKNAEGDDEYGDYDSFDNINSVVINNQDNLGSLLIKKNDVQKKLINESNSNTKNLASSESKYEGEFAQSNLDQIKDLKDKNKSSAVGESVINQINKENKAKKNLEDLSSKIVNKEEQVPNIYSNKEFIANSNNNKNIINSNNFLNSVNSGDSINVKNIIKNEVKKYDNYIPGYSKNEYGIGKYGSEYNNENNYQYNNYFKDNNYNKKNSFDLNKLRKINNERFAFFKASKVQVDLLKLKNDEALKQERKKRELIEIELNIMKEKYAYLIKEIEKLNNQKNQDFKELKEDYEHRIKSIENNIISKEVLKAQNTLKDMDNKYQIEIIKKNNEYAKLKDDYEYLQNRYKLLDEEYKKIKDMNEKDEEIHELKTEIYRLHEENNKLKQKQNLSPEALYKDNKNNNNKSDTMKVYEQLLNEREITTQENLLNNYLKEIKKLNEEILFLKSFQPGNHQGGAGPKQKNNLNNVEMTLNNINYNKNKNNYVINTSLQESAEKQIRKLKTFYYLHLKMI